MTDYLPAKSMTFTAAGNDLLREASKERVMKIRTSISPYSHPHNWQAIDDDTYDGAEDSPNRFMVGYGTTKDEAIEDLKRLLQEEAEWEEDEAARQVRVLTDNKFGGS